MTKGKRGSLEGAIPEALHGEAPKGQPMIRGENLKAAVWRPRKVSQGTAGPIPGKSCADQRGKGKKGGERPKAHHRHGGKEWARENVGAPLHI